MVLQYEKADALTRDRIVELCRSRSSGINNWDIVDAFAPKILGPHVASGDRGLLDQLAASGDLWLERSAIVATLYFINADEFDDTLRLADALLHHEHDLIHKAVGWMLREVGKGDEGCLTSFLRTRYPSMPRTMLRYAIEKLPKARRQAYLKGTA